MATVDADAAAAAADALGPTLRIFQVRVCGGVRECEC